MNISKKIKEQRGRMSLSQEELGERVYVTRQTISNWENGKSYPDVHSLILLSQVFDITIDNLVKGDLEIMEQKIEQHDIAKMKRHSIFLAFCTGAGAVVLSASWFLGSIHGLIIAFVLFAVAAYSQIKVQKIMKLYDVQTYREILAFTKGESLDEITRLRESGKRGYQKLLWLVSSALLGLIISQVIWLIL